jgi:hypothetical protein
MALGNATEYKLTLGAGQPLADSFNFDAIWDNRFLVSRASGFRGAGADTWFCPYIQRNIAYSHLTFCTFWRPWL